MKRFKNILVHVDTAAEAQPALARAATLAKENHGTLRAIQVLHEMPWYSRLLLPDAECLQDVVTDVVQEKLEALVAPLREEGLEVSANVVHSRHAIGIVEEVLRGGHDLVVKDVQPSPDPLDTIDLQLLRKCPSPVWLVRARAVHPFQRILAAVDPHPEEAANDLNRKILELATSLAEREGGELHVVHAWKMFGESVLASRLPPAEVRRYVDETHAQVSETLDRLLEPFRHELNPSRVHLLKGDATTVIPELVEQRGVDLIVMGTVARTGVSGLVIGNTAETILRRVGSSVLAVKPDGFISPVTLG